ncbi:MAG: hypothetical protein WCJ30_26925 [Deltaproteobacteria bacterium]
MPKKKKKKSVADSASAPLDALEPTPSESDRPRGRGGLIAMVAVLTELLGAGGFVTWHRRKDPARQWARRIEALHAQKVEARLSRCFGGSTGDAIRAVMNEARHGAWATSYRHCVGPTYTELIAAPMDFLSDITAPPGNADDAQARERGRLERLRGSLQALERATSGLDRGQPVPEEARDRVATALEDVAIKVNNEHQSMEDLTNVVEAASTWW